MGSSKIVLVNFFIARNTMRAKQSQQTKKKKKKMCVILISVIILFFYEFTVFILKKNT